ncbi:hypothetical protein AB0E01_02525 [Nocardia vinacea]|uniref:hypothetical protein n=1 Tax=Nocardia vinacea TaxID=96468 RepID=UPI0033DC4408
MFNKVSGKLFVGLVVAAAGLGGSFGVASAAPADGYQAVESVCGPHQEGTQLWYHNCSNQDQTINIVRPIMFDQTYCVKAGADEWVASTHETDDYPIGYTQRLDYLHDGC